MLLAVLLAALLAALLAGVLAVLCATSAVAVARDRDRADRSQRVSAAADALLVALLDAETGQRGYLLTGDDAFLQPYEEGRQRVPAALERLQAEAAEVPAARAPAQRLAAAVAAKDRLVQRIVALARAGQTDAAVRVVTGGTGKAAMDEVRVQVDEVRAAAGAAAGRARAAADRWLVAALAAAVALAGLVLTLALRRAGAAAHRWRVAHGRGEDRFRRLFEGSVVGMAVLAVPPAGPARVVAVNPVLADLVRVPREGLVGADPLAFVGPQDGAEVADGVRRCASDGVEEYLGERTLQRPDGTTAFVVVSVRPLPEVDGDTGCLLEVLDVTERRVTEAALAHQALHDPLTDLPNRVLALDHLELAVTRLTRVGGLVAVVYVDLDGFKDVNDRRGHAVGDRVLVEQAARLRSVVRDADTAARMGGDEFLVVSPDLASADDALRLARRVVDALGRPLSLGGHAGGGEEVVVTASAAWPWAGPARRRSRSSVRPTARCTTPSAAVGPGRYWPATRRTRARRCRGSRLHPRADVRRRPCGRILVRAPRDVRRRVGRTVRRWWSAEGVGTRC